MQNAVFFSDSTDPFHNLALEEALFSSVREGCVLYLRQSVLNVSIGRNQNAWKACRFSLLEQEGGKLLRRLSGGGAIYGDEGALAFTFITPRGNYDAKKQEDVLLHALFTLSAEAQCRDGQLYARRDNARLGACVTRISGVTAMHQGVIYVNADLERMARYLAPSSKNGLRPDTLGNVCAYGQGTHMENVKRALIEAFIRQFGPARIGQLHALDREEIAREYRRLSSADWRFLNDPRYELTLERRFPFGNVELQFHIREGRVMDVNAYSDAMDTDFINAVAPALKGSAFRAGELSDRLNGTQYSQCMEIALWLSDIGF